jgi:CHAD domain-containing protein
MAKKVQNATCVFGANFMLEQLNNLEKEIDGAIDGKDIEYIHRLRVASRRLRSGMACFMDCLPGKKASPWRSEIRQITRTLGAARDLDIQMECLNQLYDDELDTKFKPGYRRVLLRLKQKRAKAQLKVDKTLANLRGSDILLKMRQSLERLSSTTEDIYLFTPSLYQRAYKNINVQLDEFLGYEKDIVDPGKIKELHAMRISGKHLRYTLEIYAPLYGRALLPYVQVMKDLQDTLGNIHDDDVWVMWLPTFIEQEEKRIEDYFGNTGPLKRLLPGIRYLIDNRQQDRDKEYQSFLSMWQTLENEKAWKTLKEIIGAPINVEAALEHLVSVKEPEEGKEELTNAKINPESVQTSTEEETSPSTGLEEQQD